MKNPFRKIDVEKNTIPTQKKVGTVVGRKKVGRPKAPNMEKYLIKMDRYLHLQLANFCKKSGLNKSAVITIAVRKYITRGNHRNI